jgi:iron complex outermembrane receptor protein
MQHILSIFALLFFTLSDGAAKTGILKGNVTDIYSHEPLAGVYVIYGRDMGTVTDSKGNYLIETEAGELNVTFRYIGYRPENKRVMLPSNDTLVLNIGLEMEVREMDQIVVSAERTEQKIAELTVSMDIVKPSLLSGNHFNDAMELINKTSGIEVLDGQASVRGGSGFSYGAGSRVLALIDGLPVLSADAGNIKWQFLPMENLSQIEIIKGASSVLYGSSALNGIINFRSAEAGNTAVNQFYLETGIFTEPRNKNWVWWDTPRSFSSASLSHLKKYGKTDLGFSGYLLNDEGYRRFNGEKLGRISLKLKKYSSKADGLTYGINFNSGYTVKRDFVLWEDAVSGALKQSWSTAAELHGGFLAIDPFISLKKSERNRHDLKMRIQFTGNRFPVNNTNNSDAVSFYSEYQFSTGLLNFMDLTTGVSENYSRVTSLFYGNHTGLNMSGFAQFGLKPVKRFKFVAGFRLEYNELDNIKDKVVPIFRTGLNWQAADNTYLRASFGQGYRYPSIAEKFASTTLGSVRIIPNPDVRSESGWSSEIGIKQGIRIGDMSGQADLSAFFLQNKDLIEYMFGLFPGEEEGAGFKAANVEQSRIYGYEIEFSAIKSFGEVVLNGNGGYTFIYPVEYSSITHENTDTFLKYRRKHSGKISVNTSWKKFNLGSSLYIKSRILNIDDVFLNPGTRETILPGFYDYWLENNTGYGLLDVTLGYGFNEKLKLSLAVKNITNTEYMGRPGDIQPHRNFSLRLSGKF